MYIFKCIILDIYIYIYTYTCLHLYIYCLYMFFTTDYICITCICMHIFMNIQNVPGKIHFSGNNLEIRKCAPDHFACWMKSTRHSKRQNCNFYIYFHISLDNRRIRGHGAFGKGLDLPGRAKICGRELAFAVPKGLPVVSRGPAVASYPVLLFKPKSIF